jgi:hypothetical protein
MNYSFPVPSSELLFMQPNLITVYQLEAEWLEYLQKLN